uniref:Uncharacterized protein n=1 Tax=Arundo donax TaxID=35708 RepID=A0A0A9GST1_ARUDO
MYFCKEVCLVGCMADATCMSGYMICLKRASLSSRLGGCNLYELQCQ